MAVLSKVPTDGEGKTKILKASIGLRAKYRVDRAKIVQPFLIVPHPKNRGGKR